MRVTQHILKLDLFYIIISILTGDKVHLVSSSNARVDCKCFVFTILRLTNFNRISRNVVLNFKIFIWVKLFFKG